MESEVSRMVWPPATGTYDEQGWVSLVADDWPNCGAIAQLERAPEGIPEVDGSIRFYSTTCATVSEESRYQLHLGGSAIAP